jgi:hypothetical protein
MDRVIDRRAAALALIAVMAAGCSWLDRSERETAKQEVGVGYYTDLGPATIDVSGYPPEQQRNYAVYSRVCSQCHTLARANNCPVVARAFWELYIGGMRRHSYYYYQTRTPITREESRAVLDFLDYDSQARKLLRKEEFDLQTKDLKRRFDQLIDERVQERRQ